MTVSLGTSYIDARQYMFDAHKCKHGDEPPPLTFTNVPDGTASLAVQVYDSTKDFTHWLAWDVGTAQHKVGLNSYNRCDYRAPCPPAADGVHEYVVTAYALTRVPDALQVPACTVTKAIFDNAMKAAAPVTARTKMFFAN